MRWTLAKTYTDADCPVVGFLTSRPRTPESLIDVVDWTVGIPENATTYNTAALQPVETDVANEFNVSGTYLSLAPSGQVLLTDQFISGMVGVPDIPLTFRYEPRFDVAANDPQGALIVRTAAGERVDPRTYRVELGDQPLDPSGYEGQYSPRLVWNQQPSGLVHRTRLLLGSDVAEPGTVLTVEYPAWRFGSIQHQREFVNPASLYVEGVDWERDEGGRVITMRRLAGAQQIAAQRHPRARVWANPVTGHAWGAWSPRIHLGHFARSTDLTDPSGSSLYHVPNTEPALENTTIEDGLIEGRSVTVQKVRHEEALRVDDHTIQVQRTPLAVDVSGVAFDDTMPSAMDRVENLGYPWYVPLSLDDSGSGIPVQLGGSPSGITVYVGETPVPQDEIVDWHKWSGLIRLSRTIGPTQPVHVSYRHEIQDVEVRSLDFNPRLDNPVWASGAIRVVLTPDNLAWHHTAQYPSGLYTEMSDMGWSVADPPVLVPLLSGVVLSEYHLQGYRPADVEIIDIRRPGGGLLTTRLRELPFADEYVDGGDG